jgi:hypothetical protein
MEWNPSDEMSHGDLLQLVLQLQKQLAEQAKGDCAAGEAD